MTGIEAAMVAGIAATGANNPIVAVAAVVAAAITTDTAIFLAICLALKERGLFCFGL